MLFKIGALKNFANFTRKHLCWSLFLKKFQAFRPETLLKSDSNAGVFCETCKIFKNIFLNRKLPVAASETDHDYGRIPALQSKCESRLGVKKCGDKVWNGNYFKKCFKKSQKY